MKEITDFIAALQPSADRPSSLSMVRGSVTSVISGVCSATISGGSVSVEVSYMSHYSPSVSDEVLIIVSGKDRVILGKIH